MSSLPTEQEVFQCLCKDYGSSAAFSEIAARTDLFPYGSMSAETWLRKTTNGSILVTEDKEGKVTVVHAFSTHARLCLDYSYTGECDNHNCTYLHICRDYITNSCSRGVTCQLNHHFHNQRDRAFLSKISFDQFTDLQLQMLVLSSSPEICVKYNTDGKCMRADSCTKIHICHGYLRKCCSGDKCGLLHETAMDTDHTKAVLKRLMLNNVDKHEAMKMILDNELSLLSDSSTMLTAKVVDSEPSLSENVTMECHTHQDKPDASSICSQFLIGRCDKGSACTELHCSLPYHWQYKVSLFDEWKCFTDGDNFTLEELYCDVNVKTLVNFKPAEPLDFSRLERLGRFPVDIEYEITIDLDNMTITFQRPRGGEGLLAGLLRRLSTVSYVTWPCESMFTNWKWYWKGNGNVWHLYDYAESDLQKQIEQAYQDMLGQRETEAMHQFLISENVYSLFLYSTREMYQVSMKTGTKRQVKRRPEKPISHDDLNEWARGDSTAKKKVQEGPVTTNIFNHVPSHLPSMRVNVSYTRVALDAASTEFQEVEKLFFRSMNRRAVIRNIDRVENPLIWEEYCRNKEKMMQKAHLLNQQQVNEKRLFHGTSPENVEAICEENFDPRIHKNNRTLMLGQGTYFAVNAVISHSYAKEDSNLFQYMFLAKVLVGSYTEGHGLRCQTPSPMDFANVDTRLYDSRVDNILSPTIFVVFDRNHFYPEYVIQYSSAKPPFGRPLLLKKRSAQYLTPSSSTQSRFSASALSSAELTGTTVTKCTYNLGTASLPSDSATQSSDSASTVSRAELTGTTPTKCSDNPGTASLKAGIVEESCYSVSTLLSSELVGVETRLNAQIISMLKGTVAESGHLASVVSGSELTSVNPTRTTVNLGSAFTPSRTAAESNTPHQDKPDASICPQFLVGRCDKGSACTELHCSLPFHWQYKASLFDEWKCFTDEDNLAVEKMYCDENVGTLVNFKPAQPLDLSRLQKQGRFPDDMEYEITIDLDNMTITFQRPRSGEGLLAGLLRRLSIASHVTWPYESVFTNWKWYWKDNGNVWRLYDKDHLKRDLQEQIEQAYQDMLGQGKTEAMYQFVTSENVYNLFFYSTRAMCQVNMRTGNKRQVKRRPEKPISHDDLVEWARGDSKKKIEGSPVKTTIPSHVPIHWSSMPLNVPYTRVALDAASPEFEEVEQLLKRSMNGRAVIENIDRVQSPLIWEEYSRSKEREGNSPYCGPFQPESASPVSHAEVTGTSVTSSPDSLGTAYPPSASTTQSSYSTSTVSSAELTGTTPTRSSDNIDTASLPNGSTRQSSYAASSVSNAQRT